MRNPLDIHASTAIRHCQVAVWLYAGNFIGVSNVSTGSNITAKKRYGYTSGALGEVKQTITYGYDTVWKDKLTSYNGASISYDDIGNPTSDGTWTYTWENGRQLASMTDGTTNVSFKYNANGLRVQKKVGTVETNYTLHGKNIVHMVHGSDDLHFFYDAHNKPAVVVYNGTAYAYAKNLQGDIIAILNNAGTAVVTYTYDAWGKPTSTTGTMKDTLGKLNPFRYRGYVFDEETGAYYLCSRYYNPVWCRFANADMQINCFGDIVGKNIYCYCNNIPVISIDRDGRKPGDAFSTPDEAALDFAKCYNGLSISQNREYASIIYKRTETTYLIDFLGIKLIPTQTREYYTYSEPSVGTENETADMVVPDDPNYQLIAWIHSHGAYMAEYDGRMFSRDDYSVADQLLQNEGITYSYLSTPSGYLWKYDAITRQLELISSDIPFDPNDPDRITMEGK